MDEAALNVLVPTDTLIQQLTAFVGSPESKDSPFHTSLAMYLLSRHAPDVATAALRRMFRPLMDVSAAFRSIIDYAVALDPYVIVAHIDELANNEHAFRVASVALASSHGNLQQVYRSVAPSLSLQQIAFIHYAVLRMQTYTSSEGFLRAVRATDTEYKLASIIRLGILLPQRWAGTRAASEIFVITPAVRAYVDTEIPPTERWSVDALEMGEILTRDDAPFTELRDVTARNHLVELARVSQEVVDAAAAIVENPPVLLRGSRPFLLSAS